MSSPYYKALPSDTQARVEDAEIHETTDNFEARKFGYFADS